jgi:transcriptional regulator with GAF, ATPase, and Fis domain
LVVGLIGGAFLHTSPHREVHSRIADLARTLHSLPDEPAAALVQRITECAVDEIPAVQYAGVTLVLSQTQVESPAATHAYPALLDYIQGNHRQGPCLSAAWHEHTVRVDDLSADDRWPLYRRDALEATPIRSILSFRLFVAGHTMGALNLFADEPYAFDGEVEEAGYVLATHTALAWDTARQAENFRSALASRDVIGQAKGILMARFDIDAVRAFELLKHLSQETNTKLIEVARTVTTVRRF